MDSTQNEPVSAQNEPLPTQNETIPAIAERHQAAMDYVRLCQIEMAVKFLQFHHNHGGARSPVERARYVLFQLLNRAGAVWFRTLISENPEEYRLALSAEDYTGEGDYEDELFYKEIWTKLRKSWMEGMSVQDAIRKVWLIFVDRLREDKEFRGSWGLQHALVRSDDESDDEGDDGDKDQGEDGDKDQGEDGDESDDESEEEDICALDKGWDEYSSEEKEEFFNLFFSVGEDAFAQWISDLATRQVEDPSVRRTDKYASDYGEWKESWAELIDDDSDIHVFAYEFGQLGAEPRHWSIFLVDFRNLCKYDLNHKFEEQFSREDIDSAFKPTTPSKEELDAATDKDCPICYRAFIMPDIADTGDEAGEVHPVKIHCGHIFCGECLAASLENARSAKCPKCRAVPTGGSYGWTAHDSELNWDRLVVDATDDPDTSENEEHPQAIVERVIRGFDEYMATLPSDVFEDGKLTITRDYLQDLANHVFGPTEQAYSFLDRYPDDENVHYLYRIGVSGIISMRNRLAAYLAGDVEEYRRELERGLQLKALAEALKFFHPTVQIAYNTEHDWENLRGRNEQLGLGGFL